MSESAILRVTGMKCGGCESNLTRKLAAIDGVLSVNASHQSHRVELEFDSGKTDLETIIDTIEDAGFSVED